MYRHHAGERHMFSGSRPLAVLAVVFPAVFIAQLLLSTPQANATRASISAQADCTGTVTATVSASPETVSEGDQAQLSWSSGEQSANFEPFGKSPYSFSSANHFRYTDMMQVPASQPRPQNIMLKMQVHDLPPTVVQLELPKSCGQPSVNVTPSTCDNPTASIALRNDGNSATDFRFFQRGKYEPFFTVAVPAHSSRVAQLDSHAYGPVEIHSGSMAVAEVPVDQSQCTSGTASSAPSKPAAPSSSSKPNPAQQTAPPITSTTTAAPSTTTTTIAPPAPANASPTVKADISIGCSTPAGQGAVLTFTNTSSEDESFTVTRDAKAVEGSPVRVPHGPLATEKLLPLAEDESAHVVITDEHANVYVDKNVTSWCQVKPTDSTATPAPLASGAVETPTEVQGTEVQRPGVTTPNSQASSANSKSEKIARTGSSVWLPTGVATLLCLLGSVVLSSRRKSEEPSDLFSSSIIR